MDFNLLFAVLTSFSFVLKFSVNSEEKQDFFLFNGLNVSAHLYRENDSFYLYVNNQQNFSIYLFRSSLNCVEFSWDGFVMNNEKMELIRSTGEVSDLNFNALTFTSPLVDFACINSDCNALEPLYQLENVNYGYIAIMLCIAFVLIETKAVGLKLYDRTKRKKPTEYMTVLDLTNESKV
jgi:hypothetical protein